MRWACSTTFRASLVLHGAGLGRNVDEASASPSRLRSSLRSCASSPTRAPVIGDSQGTQRLAAATREVLPIARLVAPGRLQKRLGLRIGEALGANFAGLPKA